MTLAIDCAQPTLDLRAKIEQTGDRDRVKLTNVGVEGGERLYRSVQFYETIWCKGDLLAAATFSSLWPAATHRWEGRSKRLASVGG